MLDVLGILTVVAFFFGCEAYIGYCERLRRADQESGGGR